MFQKHTLHLSQHGKDLLLQSYYNIVGKMIKLRSSVFLLIRIQELSHISTPAQPLPATQNELTTCEVVTVEAVETSALVSIPTWQHHHPLCQHTEPSQLIQGSVFNTVLVIQKD